MCVPVGRSRMPHDALSVLSVQRGVVVSLGHRDGSVSGSGEARDGSPAGL